jgi:AcrR family transcriptional regulator
MPKVTQQYRDARREQILSAARRCILRDGFHATSMQDLFAEAGLSSGAVYRYFASKDDMIIAIAEENMKDVVAVIHSLATQQPGRSMGAALADVFEIVQAKHARDSLGALAVVVWAEALRNPTLAKKFRRLLTKMRTDLADAVREKQASGDLPGDVSADALAAIFMALVPGYIVQLALLGPAAVDGTPDAVRALWP